MPEPTGASDQKLGLGASIYPLKLSFPQIYVHFCDIVVSPSVQHVLECIVMAGIQRTKLSDSFTTFDTIKPIYFTATLICSDALPILGVISAVTFIRV